LGESPDIPAGLGASGENFSQTWRQQKAALHSSAESRFGTEGVAEILSLSQERDPQMFFEGLLVLGRRLEHADRLPQAAQVYELLSGALKGAAGAAVSDAARAELRARAEASLDAMLGRGASGPRFEFLARRLVAEATDPALLFGMTAAGIAFRLGRFAALSRLSLATDAGFWTRGWGLRFAGYTAGMIAEAPVFTAGVRLGHAGWVVPKTGLRAPWDVTWLRGP
jgi:hypothetical protein